MEILKLTDTLPIRNLKKEYMLKKYSIAKRLKEFDLFYNEPYSWFFNNGKMELRKVEKNDNERLERLVIIKSNMMLNVEIITFSSQFYKLRHFFLL